MRRLYHYLVNNIREHLMLYIALWLLLALIDIIYIVFAELITLTKADTSLCKNKFRTDFLNDKSTQKKSLKALRMPFPASFKRIN